MSPKPGRLDQSRSCRFLKVATHPSNRFSAATRARGRALKTECVLQDMSEPLHALARAVSYGQRGRISARGLRPGDRVLVSDPDPRLHRLLAGPGDLTAGRGAGRPVRPRPAASCQPDRVEKRHPLRRNQD